MKVKLLKEDKRLIILADAQNIRQIIACMEEDCLTHKSKKIAEETVKQYLTTGRTRCNIQSIIFLFEHWEIKFEEER